VDHLSMEFATRQAGVSLTVHADSPTGPVVASFPAVPYTGSTSLNDRVYRWLAAAVTDPGGVHDLYFVGDWPDGVQPELFVRFLRFQTAPDVAAAVTPPPAVSDWHTSDVTVSVTASPLWDRQVSVDGGPWVSAPVVVSAEGTHAVGYRAVDVAGVVSPVGATTVRLDKTAPAVVVPGVPQGHSAAVDVPVADPVSGVSTATVTLDGVPVTTPVELWHYPAGVHQLSVTATDVAGNTTSSTTALTITTSLPELTPLLTRFPPAVPEVAVHAHATDGGATRTGPGSGRGGDDLADTVPPLRDEATRRTGPHHPHRRCGPGAGADKSAQLNDDSAGGSRTAHSRRG